MHCASLSTDFSTKMNRRRMPTYVRRRPSARCARPLRGGRALLQLSQDPESGIVDNGLWPHAPARPHSIIYESDSLGP